MFFPEGMTFGLAQEIIDSSPVFASERRDRRVAGRRKGFARRDRRRRLTAEQTVPLGDRGFSLAEERR